MPAEPPPLLRALEALAADLGANRDLVQGAGGNASLKHAGVLWVKASGTWMADALRRPTFVAVELAAVSRMLESEGAAFEPTRLPLLHGGDGLRPSIETPLHALMPQAVVVHVHSVRALALAVQVDAAGLLAQRLDGLRWAFVPYCRPGAPLTHAIAEAIAGTRHAPDVLVLGNHGLVVAGDDVESAHERLLAVEARLEDVVRPAPPPQLDALQSWMSATTTATWRLPLDPVVHGLGTDAASFRAFSAGVLYPDHVVFLGDAWPAVELHETLEAAHRRHFQQHGRDTPFWVLRGAGVVVRDDIAAGAESMLECAARVGRRLRMDDRLRTLDAHEVAALNHWDAEAYRAGRVQRCSS